MDEPASPERPIPSPTPLTRPYWDAAAGHRLAVQRCGTCAHFMHPPRPECPECLGRDLGFVEVSGLGSIETFTLVHRTFAPGFTDRVPYPIAWIELAEQAGLRILANVIGCEPESLRIGLAVEVAFEHLDGFGDIPQFRPVSATDQRKQGLRIHSTTAGAQDAAR